MALAHISFGVFYQYIGSTLKMPLPLKFLLIEAFGP
jgi:hypothetical protein